jgi:hypothetical protein
MSDFEREQRYFVFKIKEVHQLPNYLWDSFADILEFCDKTFPQRQYVVVEDDWPEYETVWKMIEDRVGKEGGANADPV